MQIEIEDGTILFSSPSYESALIGVTTDGVAVYSYDKMVQHLIKNDNMDEGDAIDFIEFNTIGSLSSCNKYPIVMYNLA